MTERLPTNKTNHGGGGDDANITIHHDLDVNAFQVALERYVDENKPDPLVLRQIQGWEMSWSSSLKQKKQVQVADSLSESEELVSSFVPTNVLQGTLTWKNDYAVAEIDATCCWEPSSSSSSLMMQNNHKNDNDPDTSDTTKRQSKITKGSLYFALRAALRFRSKHDRDKKTDASSSSSSRKDKDEKKAKDKIRVKMMERLKEDIYVKRLLPNNNSGSTNKNNSDNANTKSTNNSSVLCEARVTVSSPAATTATADGGNNHHHQQPGQLEERVDVTDSVAEGLRRALFSQAESSLDVVEVLLSLPFLPGTSHADAIKIHCPLADRAKLRLLEDAMFDACEREGEDELMDDLEISSSKDNNNNIKDNNNSSCNAPRGQHKHRAHSHNKSNKRTKL